MSINQKEKDYYVSGRDTRIELSLYTVVINGRSLIDYDKLKQDNPALYNDIVNKEIGPNFDGVKG